MYGLRCGDLDAQRRTRTLRPCPVRPDPYVGAADVEGRPRVPGRPGRPGRCVTPGHVESPRLSARVRAGGRGARGASYALRADRCAPEIGRAACREREWARC